MLNRGNLIQNSLRIRSFALSSSQNDKQENRLLLTGNKKIDQMLDTGKLKLFEVMSVYEEAIGLKEIKQAQENVLQVKF